MPPAVALKNYVSSGKLWRIFSQTGTFLGVFSMYTVQYMSYRISLVGSAQLGWQGTLLSIFRVPRSSFRVRRSSIGTYKYQCTADFEN